MSDKPDFEALRARRNEAVTAEMKKIADEEGVPLQSLRSNFNPDACYCACPSGPCEHDWSGPMQEFGSVSTVVCAKCEMSAFSHDMRTMP